METKKSSDFRVLGNELISDIKKGLLVVAFLSIILVCLSFVSAIQGVCTGTQTCFCSGRAVDCPCNADPCIICGPTSPECTGQTGAAQTGTSGTAGAQEENPTGIQEEANTQNPQTFEDYAATLAKGLNTIADNLMKSLQNFWNSISSLFSKKTSETQGNQSAVYDIKGKVWRNSSGDIVKQSFHS